MSPRNLVTLKNEDIMKPSDWRRIVVILPAVAMVHFTGSQMTDNDLDDKPRCLLNSRGFDESIPGVDGHGEDGDSVDVSGQESLDSVGALDQENGDLGRPTDEEINEFWLRHGFFSEDERSVGDDEVFLPTKEVTSEELSLNSFLSAEDRNWIPTFSRENLALSIDESVVDSHASSEAEKLCSSNCQGNAYNRELASRHTAAKKPNSAHEVRLDAVTINSVLKPTEQWTDLIHAVGELKDDTVVMTKELLGALIALTKQSPTSKPRDDCELDNLWEFEVGRSRTMDEWLAGVCSNDSLRSRIADIAKLKADLQEATKVTPALHMRVRKALTHAAELGAVDTGVSTFSSYTKMLGSLWSKLSITKSPAGSSSTKVTTDTAGNLQVLSLVLDRYTAFLEAILLKQQHDEKSEASAQSNSLDHDVRLTYDRYLQALSNLCQRPPWLVAYASLLKTKVSKSALLKFCRMGHRIEFRKCDAILQTLERLGLDQVKAEVMDNVIKSLRGDGKGYARNFSQAWCVLTDAIIPDVENERIEILKASFREYADSTR